MSISGCARGRVFTVGRDPEHETSFVMELGTKVRLEGDKKVLADVKAHEGTMVELTGLMKRSDVAQPGVGLAGGKVRITPVMPNNNGRSPGVDPGPQDFSILDSWRQETQWQVGDSVLLCEAPSGCCATFR